VAGVEGVLRALGLTKLDERVYLMLLDRPRATMAELGRAAGLSTRQVITSCRALEERRLVSRDTGRVPHFLPAPPDTAITALVLRQQAELERTRVAASQLLERYRAGSAHDAPVELVEVLTGRDAVVRRFEQFQQAAQKDILVFDRPPYALDPAVNPDELELLRRGVRARVIYDSQALRMKGQPDILRTVVAAGEEARVTSGLPMKLVIVDRRVGLIPLRIGESQFEAGGIVVHPSPLLEAMLLLFETLWEGAVVIRFSASRLVTDAPAGGLSETDEKLIVLLAAGVKDEGIARQLGISERTVERRITRLMQVLGVQTKFQAGLQVAARGWLR
jgi:sugar-specific transcriptional regulator TrmB/DNA-binding CsgD family transcriptional regulator